MLLILKFICSLESTLHQNIRILGKRFPASTVEPLRQDVLTLLALFMHKSGIMNKISKVVLETFATSKIENLSLIEEALVCLTTTELHISSIILEVAI